MQRSEFEKMTGIYVSNSMYSVIEKYYLKTELDKEKFCELYKNNTDGIAEAIQIKADAKASKEQTFYFDNIAELEKEIKEYDKEVNNLKVQLEKELEWKIYDDNRNISQEEYDDMCGKAEHLSDYQAKVKLNNMFGFDFDYIRIIRSDRQQEINRHGVIRQTSVFVKRDPLYESSDYNYIAFNVCGYDYECVCGELYKL